MSTLKFLSFNARGLRQPKKRRRLFAYLHRRKADFILIQESHSSLNDEKFWLNEWGGKILFSHGSTTSKGVCILFSPHLYVDILKYSICKFGRYLIVDVKYCDCVLTVVGVYGPNNDNPAFFREMFNDLYNFQGDSIIMAGDFNFVFNLDLDKVGGLRQTNFKAREECLSLMSAYNLVDIWREKNPLSKHYSWSSNITPGIHCRLDFFLVSRSIEQAAVDVSFSPGIQSDHSFIALSVVYTPIKRGPGYWKFNNSLLQDDTFVEIINEIIRVDAANPNAADPSLRWETLKFKFRQAAIKYSKEKAFERRRKEKALLLQIAYLEHQLFFTDSDETRSQLKIAQTALLSYYDYKLQGTIIRSRVRWVEEGEKNTKYFLNLEKRTKELNHIRKLSGPENRILNDGDDILREIRRFYSSLYASNNTSVGSFFCDVDHTGLSHDDSSLCDGELTLHECSIALSMLQNDKAPGTDGLTTNFYKHFWHLIGPLVTDSVNYGYRNGSLSPEQTRGVITLILKQGKNPTQIQNYRPITLLNTDYKLGAKAIAARLKSVIQPLIGPQQTGFLKGRYIGENIRFILDLINYTNDSNIPGLLFLIDFEKAFDKLEWNFIQATLSFFNFGSSFKRWISTFYNNTQTCVCNNGYSTGFFKVERGVRQGCPLSPYLFILCVEVLALKVLQSNSIHGILVDGCETRILQYADDTTFLLDGSRNTLCNVLSLLNEFKCSSGLKINLSKSHLFPLRPLVRNIPSYLNDFALKVTLGPISMLGVTFTHNGDDLFRLNYQPKLSRLKNSLRIWTSRDLTPIGRNIIVKSFGLSQLVFLFLVLPNPPKAFIKEVESTIFDFIWGGNPDKVRRSVVINPISSGGLNVTNINSFVNSLKCTWIKRYFSESSGPWKSFFNLSLKAFGYTFLFNCNCKPVEVEKIENVFIKEVVQAWCNISYSCPKDNYGMQILWNNSNIRINGNVVFHEDLIAKNVLHVKNLFDREGKPLSFDCFKEKFNVENLHFTFYWGLIHSIPISWRRELSDNNHNQSSNQYLLEEFLKAPKSSHYIYGKYIRTISESPTAIQKWAVIFDDITEQDWYTYYRTPWCSVTEARVIYFQFRFIHRILPTNRLLSFMGKTDSSLCTFCGTDDESIEHLFWACSITAEFILEVERLILLNQFVFSQREFFFSYRNANHPYNFLALYMKQFIFDCKLQKKQPVANEFYYKFKFVLKVEQHKKSIKKNKVRASELRKAFALCPNLFID